jgi:hypothetical protein
MRVVRDGQTVSPLRQPWSRVVGIFFCHCSSVRRAALRFHSWRDSRRPEVAHLETA